MLIKKDDKTIEIPNWLVLTAIYTVEEIVKNICKVKVLKK